jgi:hypothetical protein
MGRSKPHPLAITPTPTQPTSATAKVPIISNSTTTTLTNNSISKKEEEEGTHHIRQQNLLVLHQDFTLVCRIGGEFAAGIDDPSDVLFRYVNCLHFIGEGKNDAEHV